jgi:hypothetical protein
MNAQSSRSHTLFLLYITGVHAASGQQLNGHTPIHLKKLPDFFSST